MNDAAHILEEFRSLRGAHVDVMTKMSDVCGEVRELVAELRHAQRNYESLSGRFTKLDEQVRVMQLENATNKPILDIARSMYRSQWMTILAAIGAVAGTNIDKLLG